MLWICQATLGMASTCPVAGVKSKYTAKITAPSPLTVLMSAVPDGEPKEVEGGKRCFSFTQSPGENE